MKLRILSLLLILCLAPIAEAQRIRTPSIVTAVVSGSVPEGARKVTFLFSSDFAGTVLGATFSGAANSFLTIDAPDGDTLGAIAYTRTAGTIRIVAVR